MKGNTEMLFRFSQELKLESYDMENIINFVKLFINKNGEDLYFNYKSDYLLCYLTQIKKTYNLKIKENIVDLIKKDNKFLITFNFSNYMAGDLIQWNMELSLIKKLKELNCNLQIIQRDNYNLEENIFNIGKDYNFDEKELKMEMKENIKWQKSLTKKLLKNSNY